jgi:RNA polymerase II C-terminal domain phosphatase-like 1/2
LHWWLQTAVASIAGGIQLHLVAMLPSQKQISEGRREACFWGFVVVEGMYDSCLAMLNLRCLAMVLDLDETLIVANTSKTFDDRIDVLNRRLVNREDPVLAATLKRFQEDKAILEQYIKTDQVFDNGKLYKAQSEVVPPVADGAIPLIRPIVRLPERNVILTRINPAVTQLPSLSHLSYCNGICGVGSDHLKLITLLDTLASHSVKS